MAQLIVLCIISVSIIATFFLAWYFSRRAKNKERMALIERGEKLENILQIQQKGKVKLNLPWLKMGIVAAGMSIAFFVVGFIELKYENARELLNEFIIVSIFGICLGLSLVINHLLSKKGK